MMRKGGVWNAELALNLTYHQALGVSGEQELHDAKPGFGSHGGEHVGVLSHLFVAFSGLGCAHNFDCSRNMEEWWRVAFGGLERTWDDEACEDRNTWP